MSAIIELKNIEKSFGIYRTNRKVVLKNIDLTIEQGDFVTILGPSGSGKTTLLNILSSLDRPTKGVVKINHESIDSMLEYQLAKCRQENIGFIFQEFYLLEELTVYDNIASYLYLKKLTNQQMEEKIQDIARKIGIEDLLDKQVKECSRGQQQRVVIARALVNQPKIIVADELTGNLDYQNKKAILDLLVDLNHQGITVVQVTHDLDCAMYSHRVLYLKDGTIQDDFTTDTLTKTEFHNRLVNYFKEDESLSSF